MISLPIPMAFRRSKSLAGSKTVRRQYGRRLLAQLCCRFAAVCRSAARSLRSEREALERPLIEELSGTVAVEKLRAHSMEFDGNALLIPPLRNNRPQAPWESQTSNRHWGHPLRSSRINADKSAVSCVIRRNLNRRRRVRALLRAQCAMRNQNSGWHCSDWIFGHSKISLMR